MKDIIIIGSGGVGRETAWIIEQINEKNSQYNIIGFIDDDESKWNTEINGYKVIGGIEYLKSINYKGEVIIALANYKIKKSIIDKLKDLDITYATIIHPDNRLHNTVKVGQGTIIYGDVSISPNVCIGNHNIISSKSLMGHDCILEDYISTFWNVIIAGNNVIAEGTLIEASVSIIQNIKIIKPTMIKAGKIISETIK